MGLPPTRPLWRNRRPTHPPVDPDEFFVGESESGIEVVSRVVHFDVQDDVLALRFGPCLKAGENRCADSASPMARSERDVDKTEFTLQSGRDEVADPFVTLHKNLVTPLWIGTRIVATLSPELLFEEYPKYV